MNDQTASRVSSVFRRVLRVLATVAIPLLALGWLVTSAAGFRLLCSGIAWISNDRLSVQAPDGRLLGDWRAESVRWVDAAHDIALTQVAVDWSPRDLIGGKLAIERIEAKSVRVFVAPSDEPVTMPSSLVLPIALSVRRLAIGPLRSGRADEHGTVLAEHIEATLESDGRLHRIGRIEVRNGFTSLVANATLAAMSPFDLSAEATLTGSALDEPFNLALKGEGPLDRIRIDGLIAAGGAAGRAADGPVKASGELHALLTPFAPQPVASLAMRFTGIDPAAFVAGAPQASLDMDAVLERRPSASGGLAAGGRISVVNRLAGSLDRQRIPLESLQSTVDWQGERLALTGLELVLPGQGHLKGRGEFADRMLDLALEGGAIDAQRLHADLLPTRLGGPIRAQLGSDHQRVDLSLRDARYAIDAAANITSQAIEVSRLRLATGDAQLSAQGDLALVGEKRFVAKGRLNNFDPARFFKTRSPLRTLINADIDASGALGPSPELALHFDLRNSRLGDQALAGKGAIDLRGQRLQKVELDLDAAGNRLNAAGAFGRTGDRLRLRITAPKLESIGFSELAGDATADVTIGGDLARLEFSGDLRAERLRVGQRLDLRDVTLAGQLDAGMQGKLHGTLHCTACALPAYGIPALSINLAADGARSQHRLSGQIGLPGRRELRFAIDGGFRELASSRSANGADAAKLGWNGAMSELSVSALQSAHDQPLLKLVAPAPLNVGGPAFAFGPASFDGLVGDVRIDRLSRAQGRWESSGRWQRFRPQALLGEFPSLHAGIAALSKQNPQPLVLAGEWTISAEDKPASWPTGRVAIWRESGDLMLGSVALGLDAARIQATVGGGQLVADAHVQGARLGEITAELTAPGGADTLIDPIAPWRGRLRAKVPDVGWLGPLIGEGWQVAGRVDGELQLDGSPSRPQLSGEWRGEDLAVRALDLGMRLERGQARVEITPAELLLRQLSFECDFQPLPSVLKLDPNVDAAKLTGSPGKLEASGELAFASAMNGGDARLKIRLDRLGVVQRADQWIALSGEGDIRVGEQVLDLAGKLRVDAGLWSLAETGRPRLSDDVVIRQSQSDKPNSSVARKVRLDVDAALGRSAHFRGAGVESRLAGQIRIRSDDAGLPRASGSISTVDGRFNAYGQKLGIQRGIINFQGAIDNPGLNILAVRENLPVEAGVEVTGTALRPVIRLVSTPDVPDAEKLSWLVLGHSPEQQGGADGGVLLAAARTILGGQDGGALRQLQRGFGIDEFGVTTGEIGGYSDHPTSRVASSSGFSGSQTVSGQIVTIGKRLSSNALLSYEQSLGTSDSIVKLTVNLSRRFSVVGRAGSESALDFFWHYRFGK